MVCLVTPKKHGVAILLQVRHKAKRFTNNTKSRTNVPIRKLGPGIESFFMEFSGLEIFCLRRYPTAES